MADMAEIERRKYELWVEEDLRAGAAAFQPRFTMIAEGDSWFDYPFGLDIPDSLKGDYGYDRDGGWRFERVSHHGDTLENMAWGTRIRDDFSREAPELASTLQLVSESQPQVFLFSGGGNDIAGYELEGLLDHRDMSGNAASSLRAHVVDDLLDRCMPAALKYIFEAVWEVSADTHIITHGYGRPIPDGRGYRRLFKTWSGPWLRPAFAKKNIRFEQATRDMATLIDRFNAMLASVAAEYPGRLTYLDLRPHIEQGYWENELHLSSEGFKAVAGRFHEAIVAAVPGWDG